MSVIFISKKFKCVYCNKLRKGAYRFVDELRSCERCNRMYDVKETTKYADCPLCKGAGTVKFLKRRGSVLS